MARRVYQASQTKLEEVLLQMAGLQQDTARDVQDLMRAEPQQPFMAYFHTVTSAHTVNRVDHGLYADATGGAFNVTLPASASSSSWGVWILKVDATANAITVLPTGAETIDGDASYVLAQQWDAALLICDGTEWHAISQTHGSDRLRVVTFSVSGTLVAIPGSLRFRNPFGCAAQIKQVLLAVDTPSVGAAIIVDVHKSGTTIFTDQSHRPQIAAGANEGSSSTIDVPTWGATEYLTADVDQIGGATAGSNLVIEIVVEVN